MPSIERRLRQRQELGLPCVGLGGGLDLVRRLEATGTVSAGGCVQNSVAFSQCGSLLVSGGDDARLRVVSVSNSGRPYGGPRVFESVSVDPAKSSKAYMQHARSLFWWVPDDCSRKRSHTPPPHCVHAPGRRAGSHQLHHLRPFHATLREHPRRVLGLRPSGAHAVQRCTEMHST